MNCHFSLFEHYGGERNQQKGVRRCVAEAVNPADVIRYVCAAKATRDLCADHPHPRCQTSAGPRPPQSPVHQHPSHSWVHPSR